MPEFAGEQSPERDNEQQDAGPPTNSPATQGLFAFSLDGEIPTSGPHSSNGVPPSARRGRPKPPRRERTLFDGLPLYPSVPEPEPPVADDTPPAAVPSVPPASKAPASPDLFS